MIYDLYTLEELYELHGRLCATHTRQHVTIMTWMANGNILALMDDPGFRTLDASFREIGELAVSVHEEIGRRQAEAVAGA